MNPQKTYQFIHDEAEITKFFEIILPPLNEKEVYFISLSARNKQLTEVEREFYSLGRTEMFERKVIREHDLMKFMRTLHKFEVTEGAYTGRTGLALPSKCLILYININPCDMLKAYRTFNDEMNENIYNLLSKQGSAPEFFKRQDRLLYNNIQRAKGTKYYIDLDIDFQAGEKKDFKFITDICIMFKDRGVEYFVVETKGGTHILLKRSTLHYNYNDTLEHIRNIMPAEVKEIEINHNEMIPVPGTLQADFPVHVLYDISNFTFPPKEGV